MLLYFIDYHNLIRIYSQALSAATDEDALLGTVYVTRYTLTELGSAIYLAPEHLRVFFSLTDLNALKRDHYLAVSAETSYLSIER